MRYDPGLVNRVRLLTLTMNDELVAARLNLSVRVVRRIRRDGGSATVEEYLCPGCERRVTLRPCVICAATRMRARL